MLRDHYEIRSTWQRGRSSADTNIKVFLEHFNDFYNKVRMRKHPNMSVYLRDPYGWALMCNDYAQDLKNIKYDSDCTCKEIWDGMGQEASVGVFTYRGKFSFKALLDLLFRAYWFDYDKAIEIYNNQGSALSIFKQITNGNGYVMNRLRPDIAECAKYMKHAFESEISLDEDYRIRIPYIHKVCDGMIAPFIIMRHQPPLIIEELECHGYGEGLFVTNGKTIVDVLRINDLWLVDTPLENRLNFAYSCTQKDVESYQKTWSLRSTIEAAKLLKADSTNGILMRGARENYLSNRWFNWSSTSLLYCHNVNGQLLASSRGRNFPDWYTLEGDAAIINPYEERTKEKVWLDNWDIQEFKRILEL